MGAMTLRDWADFKVEHLPDYVLKKIHHITGVELAHRAGVRKRKKSFFTALKYRDRSLDTSSRRKELAPLLDEDWSDVYPPDNTERVYYVYAHVMPTILGFQIEIPPYTFKGIPFYIGKGTGNRAYDLKRNEGHGQEIRRLLNTESTPEDIVQIIEDKLTESEALCLEAKLIYFFGTRFDGEKNGVLVNLTKPPTPFY